MNLILTQKRAHSFAIGEESQQKCESCGAIRRLLYGEIQWTDRDNSPLPTRIVAHLEGRCPGPIDEPTIRQHYKC
jgi:hypothetical protein